MTTRWVELDRAISVSGPYRRMQVTVSDHAHNMDPGIFLYLALPLKPEATEAEGQCQGVCSPSDLVDWPLNEPNVGDTPPWFRAKTVTYLFSSEAQMEAAWATLLDEVTVLIDTLNSLDTFAWSTTFFVGTPPSSESV